PRALGNRSILADPRHAAMKGIVNERIKFREPFRPFAPIVLEDCAPVFWECLQNEARTYPYRYMLAVCRTKDDKGDQLQAVNHEGASRLQTVRREWNPVYDRAVELFGQATGVPVLLNTSFNLPAGRADRQHAHQRAEHIPQERPRHALPGRFCGP